MEHLFHPVFGADTWLDGAESLAGLRTGQSLNALKGRKALLTDI